MADRGGERSELQIQTLFRSRARMRCPAVKIVAVPNGAERGQKALNRAMKEGLQPGFPDIMCLAPGKVAFIEFKAAKGDLSEHQEWWQGKLAELGFPVTVCRDPDAGLRFLQDNGFPFLFAMEAA